jgi:tetratricopeptide (TPR) repeat protein
MMIRTGLILSLALVFAGCSTDNASGPRNTESNGAVRADKLQSTITHSAEGNSAAMPGSVPNAEAADAAKGGKWSASGDPIDTTTFDKEIADAEAALKAKPSDPAAKQAAAAAYYNRGVALTEARQYAAALGDYRRAQKIDPNHAEAKVWENRIIGIYEMMKKEYPKPGEEPKPLPFTKQA